MCVAHHLGLTPADINNCMKAIIFLGSLKQKQSQSNSAYLAQQVEKQLLERGFKEVELFNLAKLEYEPGISNRNQSGEADGMTEALARVLEADCVIFATPIWWGVHSSLIQALMERMCYYDDFAIRTNISVMYGKTFGAIISGSDDGFQQITGLLCNFATNLGFTIPPDSVVISTGQGRKDIRSDSRTQQHIEIFARNLAAWTQLLKRSDIGARSQAEREQRPPYVGDETGAMSEPEPTPEILPIAEQPALPLADAPVTSPLASDYIQERGL